MSECATLSRWAAGRCVYTVSPQTHQKCIRLQRQASVSITNSNFYPHYYLMGPLSHIQSTTTQTMLFSAQFYMMCEKAGTLSTRWISNSVMKPCPFHKGTGIKNSDSIVWLWIPASPLWLFCLSNVSSWPHTLKVGTLPCLPCEFC